MGWNMRVRFVKGIGKPDARPASQGFPPHTIHPLPKGPIKASTAPPASATRTAPRVENAFASRPAAPPFARAMINFSAPDLSAHPPRSPRVKLGGFVHLPRLLDKARASAAGRLGEFIYPCPLDQRFFSFVGITPEALLAEVAKGRSDSEMLAWVLANASPTRQAWEIAAWSDYLSKLSAGDAKRHRFFAETIENYGPAREDIVTYFDRLDLDDYASYGGKA